MTPVVQISKRYIKIITLSLWLDLGLKSLHLTHLTLNPLDYQI